jgi:hypothetical protein
MLCRDIKIIAPWNSTSEQFMLMYIPRRNENGYKGEC